jgi:hypothetical protein
MFSLQGIDKVQVELDVDDPKLHEWPEGGELDQSFCSENINVTISDVALIQEGNYQ